MSRVLDEWWRSQLGGWAKSRYKDEAAKCALDVGDARILRQMIWYTTVIFVCERLSLIYGYIPLIIDCDMIFVRTKITNVMSRGQSSMYFKGILYKPISGYGSKLQPILQSYVDTERVSNTTTTEYTAVGK